MDRDRPKTPEAPKPSLARRLLRWAVRLTILGLLALVLAALGVVYELREVEATLPDVSTVKSSYRPAQLTRILGRDGSTLAEIFVERRTVVPIASLPAHVKLAILAAEDASFYEHKGLNYLGMLRALAVNIRAGHTKQGASTITQQVVKNVILDSERTYTRKIKEALLARKLEEELTKDEILELYLNQIYFGGRRYGIEEAARYYFGKSAKELSIAEAALLGGLPKGPEIYSPRHNLEKSTERRGFVLDQMQQKGFLTPEQADAARAEPVRLAPLVDTQSSLAPEVVEIVKKTLADSFGDEAARGGFTVTTTIDPRLQVAARKAVRDNLQALDKRTKVQGPLAAPSPKKKVAAADKAFVGVPKGSEVHRALVGVVSAQHDEDGTLDVLVGDVPGVVKLADYDRYNPQHLPPSQFAELGSLVRVSFLAPIPDDPKKIAKVPLRLEQGAEGALIAVDPRTREILALVGSYEAAAGGLDRATQTRRQPGSTFKPVLYSYALHSRKVTAATLIDAGATTQSIYKNTNNEDGAAVTPIRLREGLAKSINPVALEVMREVGADNVVPWARQLGITSTIKPDLSLALGSYEVTPIEMVGVYASLAAGGVYQTPALITKIVGPDGEIRPIPARPAPVRVMEEAEAYLMTNLLESVVDHGTGAKARELGRPAAGKTGTTNLAKDAWFMGYTTDMVCGVWTGYDDPRPLGGGKEAGATAALPAWLAFMKVAEEKKPTIDFPRPAGLTVVRIDPSNGLRAYEGEEDAMDELFLPGTEPADVSHPKDAGAGGAPPATSASSAPPATSVALPSARLTSYR